MTSRQAALAFVERINAHDAAGLVALMTPHHLFVDALGRRQAGRAAMRTGWAAFFEGFPGYRIDVAEVVAEGDRVALFGTASGRTRGSRRRWNVSAAWLAVVRRGGVAQWRVCCDTGWGREPGER